MKLIRKSLLSGLCIILSVLGMAGTTKAAMEVTVNPEVSVNITVEDDSGKIIGDDSVEMRMYNSNGSEVAQWYCNNSDYISTTMVNCKAGGTFYRDVASIVPCPSESDVTISQFNIHGGYYNDLQGKFSFRYNTYYNGWLKYKVNKPEAVALTIPAGKMMISVPECFAGRKLEYAISVNAKDSTYGGTKYIFNDIAGQETYYELEPATYYTFSSLWAEKTGAMGSTGQITVSGQPTNYIRKTINISDYTGGDFESGDKYVLTYDGEEVVFDYADEGDERGFLLYIISGSVVNVVTPDKDGNVTIYVEQSTNTASYWGVCMWKTGSGRYDYQNASVESGIIDMYIKKDIRFYTLQIPQYGMTFANIPEGEYTIEQSKQIPGYIMPEPMKISVRADGVFYKCPMVNVRCDSLYYVEDEWRYYVDGAFASDYTGIVNCNGAQHYVVNGIFNQVTGLVNIGSFWYYLDNGVVDSDYVGLVEFNGSSWYVKNGILCRANGLVMIDGKWYYFVNGRHNTEYTGLSTFNGSKWYVKNGMLNRANGIVLIDGEWYYMVNGKYTPEYTGLVDYNGSQWYVKDGVLRRVNGLVQIGANWYYFVNGRHNTEYTGLSTFNGSKWYVKNGMLNRANGIVLIDGEWYYIVNGKYTPEYTGFVLYNGFKWYVKNGMLNRTTGLEYLHNGWYYLTGGRYDTSYKGVSAKNGNTWFVENGTISRVDGIWEQEGQIYIIRDGKVDVSVNTLKYYNGEWYYFNAGKVNWKYKSLVYYNGHWWYVNNGKLDKTYTGLVGYNNGLWYVKNGKLDKSYSGTVMYNGVAYYVSAGKVK